MSLTDLFGGRTLCVALAPGQLTALVRSGSRVVAGSATRIVFDPQEGHWQGALDALAAYLGPQGTAPAGLPLSLGLSTRWCQLAVLPWSDALLDEAGAQRFMEAQFAGIFGEVARAWTVRCDDAPYGQPRVACALDRALVDGLHALAAEHGRRCVALESLLPIAWRAIAATGPRAFALVEPGRLVLAATMGGRIVAVQAQALRGAWHAELPQAWRRWTLRAPELGEIAQVALVNLDADAAPAPVPAGFFAAPSASTLTPPFAAVAMVGLR